MSPFDYEDFNLKLLYNSSISMDKEHQEVSQKLIKITLMSLLFMTIELVGGYLANSIAIFADAFHLLSDVLAYLISLGAVWLSTRPNPPRQLTFGWEKAQPLGALINVAIIYVVTAELFVEATDRMLNKAVVQEPKFMLLTSLFGLGCNLIIMRILHSDPHGGHHGCSHSHGHDHGHGHSHGHHHNHQTHEHIKHDTEHTGRTIECSELEHDHCTHEPIPAKKIANESIERSSGEQLRETNDKVKELSEGGNTSLDNTLSHSLGSDEEIRQHSHEQKKKMKNINLEAAYIHILTDIILSIGVIISALIIYFLPSTHEEWTFWQLADPLCTYLFSFLAIYSTWPILKESVMLLLDASHTEDMVNDIERDIKNVQGVREIVDLKVWSTNREKHYGAVKVRMEKGYGGWRVGRVLSLRGVKGYVQLQDDEMSLTES